jgi:hypothetical protein
MLRDSPCGGTSQLRWRPLTYRHRCCRATSSMGAHLVLASLVELLVYSGVLNSLEAWFMYLTFRYRDWSTLVYFMLFVYIVAWSKKHCPDWSEHFLSSGPLLAS